MNNNAGGSGGGHGQPPPVAVVGDATGSLLLYDGLFQQFPQFHFLFIDFILKFFSKSNSVVPYASPCSESTSPKALWQ